jgi:tRNA dimethylallyltransferase
MPVSKTLPKLLVIVGPTASGKTDLALRLAKKLNGELVAADSRTIYKGMDIGTAKPSTLHHIIDVVRPDQTFTLAQYQAKAFSAIRGIIRRGKLPILVGGTGLYVRAIVDNLDIPKVPPHAKFREELGKKSASELYVLLKSMDPVAVERTGRHNMRRMIRALEVITMTGEKFSKSVHGKPLFDLLELGVSVPREKLYKRIDERVDKMMRQGFFEEVVKLRKKLYSPDLPAMSGIGYGELNAHIDGKISFDEAVQRIKFRTHQYARRQMTWFRRDKRIHWAKNEKDAQRIVRPWLTYSDP